MKLAALLGWACAAVFSLAATQALAATPCADLASLKAADVTITRAEPVDSLSEVSNAVAKAALTGAFCRVQGVIEPTRDSKIGFEVWLPLADRWNGKFEAAGNGGLLGALNHRAVLAAVNRDYAAMTTDLGHLNAGGEPEDSAWAVGHPEKVIDYAYRGEHLAVLAAKQIIEAYYGAAPRRAYYTGCSAGGIQGLTELLRYAKDFDGYVIGDATPDHLGQEVGALWNTLAASLKDPAEALKPAQISRIHEEVLRQCAGKDGGLASDPFLTDPAACRFNPASLQCQAGQEAGTCLTPAQIAIVGKIYQGPVDPRTGDAILSGVTPGSERTWGRFFTGKSNPATTDRPWAGFLMDMAYSDPAYLSQQKYLTFDFGQDYEALRRKVVAGETLDTSWNSRNRDLDAFIKAGGKVIQYHGWDDPNIPALEAVRFYQSLVDDQVRRHRLTRAQAVEATRKFYRLFMVAGMDHCAGGVGAWSFGQNGQAPLKDDPEHDTLAALDLWVEKGVAPESFVGSRPDAKTGAVDMTRSICAYPKIPVWKGGGSTSDASNFACVVNPGRQGPATGQGRPL